MRPIPDFLVAIFLIGFFTDAFAIGGSGGCGRPTHLINTTAFGTPEQLSELLDSIVKREWNSLDRKTRATVEATPIATEAWRKTARDKLINDPVPCSGTESLLDHAVNNGNLPVVSWLLDNGSDPNGVSTRQPQRSDIFSRCGAYSRQSIRPDGLTKEEAIQRKIDAYKLIISRGADLNRVQGIRTDPRERIYDDPRNALMDCRSDDMVSIFLDLGADRFLAGMGKRRKYIPLQEATWLAAIGSGSIERVRMLSRGGFNDLRGTKVEKDLHMLCAKPEYQSACTKLSSIVRLSPGIIPSANHRSKLNNIVPEEFSTYREACFFPELQFYSDFDLVLVGALKGERIGQPINADGDYAHQVDVFIKNEQKPIFLLLHGRYQTTWNIQNEKSTRIVGAMIFKEYVKAYEVDRVNGLDQNTPVYMGPDCSVWVPFSRGGIHRFIGGSSKDPTSLHPFTRKGRASREIITDAAKVEIIGPLSADANAILDSVPASKREGQ